MSVVAPAVRIPAACCGPPVGRSGGSVWNSARRAVVLLRDEAVVPGPDRGVTSWRNAACRGLAMSTPAPTSADALRASLAPSPVRGPGPGATAVLGLAVVVGLAWGAATSGLQTLLPWPFAGLANAVSPWVAPAFLVGALSRRPGSPSWPGSSRAPVKSGGTTSSPRCAASASTPPRWWMWLATALFGGPVFGTAGWCWRHVGSLRWAASGTALQGAVFVAEGAVSHGAFLHHTGDAIVFCALGALLVVALGATTAAARASGAPRRGVGAAGELALHVLLA
jgi:Family of unknown function (DUF6518)